MAAKYVLSPLGILGKLSSARVATTALIVSLMAGSVPTARAERTEVGLDKTNAATTVGHIIVVSGCGGTGCFEDGAFDNDSGTDFAEASTLFPNGAGGAAFDPHSSAEGEAYQTAFAGSGDDNESKVTFSLAILFAENEPGAFAIANLHDFSGGASALWQVSGDPEESNPWIESLITIINFTKPDPPPNPLIETVAGTFGHVVVASTDIRYESDGDLLHVFGTLTDLDGPHEIDFNTDRPAVRLMAREFVDMFETLVSHGGTGHVRADQSVGSFGAGLMGETSTSATLHAYVGTPSMQSGDFNVDGIVDAADYVTWRDNVGGPYLPNSNGLGIVGQAHYDLWAANFGAVAGGGSVATTATVPECHSLTWLVLGIVSALARSRRECRDIVVCVDHS